MINSSEISSISKQVLDSIIKRTRNTNNIPKLKSLNPKIVSEVTKSIIQKSYDNSTDIVVSLINSFCTEHNLTPPQFYNKANVTSATYSNFISKKNKPSRDTILCILLSLELNNDQIGRYMHLFDYHYPCNTPRDKAISKLHKKSFEYPKDIDWTHYIRELNISLDQINTELETFYNPSSNQKIPRLKLLGSY